MRILTSEFAGLYTSIARWANQPAMFSKMTFKQFCDLSQERKIDQSTMGSVLRSYEEAVAIEPKLKPLLNKKYWRD